MDYYKKIKERIIINEAFCRIKEYSKERSRVEAYFEIGRLLNEAGKSYGNGIIKQYSERLVNEIGTKYNERTLYRMRKFYVLFRNEKLTPLVSKLSWSHYLQLLSLKDSDEIAYYIRVASDCNLNKRELQQRVSKHEYRSLSAGAREKMKTYDDVDMVDMVPNPIIVQTVVLEENISEKILMQSIMENIDDFLKQLGDGFSYVGNEYKIKIDDRYNFIDLLLYNIKYDCYVVVELKVTALKSEHTGQTQKYMNYIDKHLKTTKQGETVGIIICKKEDRFVIEYCSDDRIIARTYQLLRKNKA